MLIDNFSTLYIIKVWLILFTVALPLAAIGLALVDYKESGGNVGDFKTFLKNYTQYTIQILLSQGFHPYYTFKNNI